LICYPNPFRDRITIEYSIGKKEMVEVDIYNMNGQKIRTLNDNLLTKGKYKTMWDGTDKNGKEVSSGIYIIRLAAGGQTYSYRIMYMK
jgi:flagellar hook assembly protein FlgD